VSTGSWLRDRYGQDGFKSDPESGLQARVSLARLGSFEPRNLAEPHSESSSPESAALELLLRAETNSVNDSRVGQLLEDLRRNERWIGGWSGRSDALFVTTRVVEALAAISTSAPGSWPLAIEMRDRAAYTYSEHPVPNEPACIAAWLKGSVLCEQDLSHASFARAIARLSALQEPDGRWLATPFEETSGRRAYMDPRCLVTTALVAEALAVLRDRLLD